MSNLSLPKMTWDTLRAKLNSGTAFRTGVAKLAYETTAEWGEWGRRIVIRHHGNAIAEIGPNFFTLTGAGWNSRTTADRLNAILRDNQTPLPAEPFVTDRLYYSVSSRDNRKEFGLYLLGRGAGQPTGTYLANIQHVPAHFSRVDSYHHYVLQGE